ncbi:Ent3p Ecym_1133 [Eremothecium cymbalariae DBVPG|uniref:ENTH domain-containing protein n=1 Tax=Eremothecium cymbalariae (strain CBS 270.75 / DBVPG 7215 / KCTC 17166 / NRRL Y-17582) TaxID=931890 RepID=G8JMN0_ERECY|nr:hypothetical protein Ecym_1133 [Eremothecium cymbalariae DBVPG\
MSLEETIGKISLYDAKKYFRKAQNVVFNYTGMEAKVREATNNESWGAPSSLMAQIAQGTYNYRERKEILGMIFRRFVEKTASEWRQIYKSVQLLEYLIYHGSEGFIDDVRSGLNLIKMLESFHYIDSQGRDQGINVRNRTQALVQLLNNDEQIRIERKKARRNAQKYTGVAGGKPSYIPDSLVNYSAGFTSSSSNAISVSADFDGDDDPDYTKPAPYNSVGNASQFQEYSPKMEKAGKYDGDSDEEFSDFQCAVPTPGETSRSNVNSLVDLYQSSPSSVRKPSVDLLSQHHQPKVQAVKPALSDLSDKKGDVFSSLFSTAKMEPGLEPKSETLAPASSRGTTEKMKRDDINFNTSDDEDGLFGDLKSAPNPSSTTTTTKTPPTTKEVDLLSF